jgi:hypothetical protein
VECKGFESLPRKTFDFKNCKNIKEEKMAAPFRIRRYEKLPAREEGVVQPAAPAAPGAVAEPAPAPTYYMERLIKLIPAEVLSLYLAGKVFLKSSRGIVIWALVCLVLVIIARIWGTKDQGKPVQWLAVVVSAISFVIWFYVVGDPQLTLPKPEIASLAVLVWTFIVPIFYKGD